MTDLDYMNPKDRDGRISVLIEMRAAPGMAPTLGHRMAEGLGGGALRLDPEFAPVPLAAPGVAEERMFAAPESYVLRGTVADEGELRALETDPQVLRVWKDTPIAPFAAPSREGNGTGPQIEDNPSMAGCPIGTCDCSPTVAKGAIADVARYLGVDQIWSRGYRGTGIVVGVLDSGITAQGRPVKPGETADRIPRVIGGWPAADWGTESSRWGNHGNMCATDVLGMAPEAQLFDLRIAGPGGTPSTVSRALQAFQWAIDHFRAHGTPQVLTNSWGMFQESWDPAYARDANHPFTRKVAEAVDLGIVVLFAAGNCGDTCPDGRCGPDVGTGRSIWGANGHEKVMTVGAVNINEQFIGYSSRGPATLSAQKPDFCSISHFRGYFGSDSGTSAATPILAGVVAVLKQAKPARTPAQLKADLIATCKDIGAPGFDIHSGHGIVRPKGAFDRIMVVGTPVLPDLIGTPVRRDTIQTLPAIDRPHTPIVPDRIATTPLRDLGTPVVLDRPRTHVVLDQGGTPPLVDRGGTPISERIDRPFEPPQPFVLSTAHQAPEWQDFDEMLSGEDDGLSALAAQIEEVQAVLEQLVAQYQAAAGMGR